MPEKICICGTFSNGGTEKAAFNLANGLSETYQVHVLDLCKMKTVFELSEQVIFARIDAGRLWNKIISIRKYIRDNRIDVLIVAEAMLGVIVIPATCCLPCKVIVWEHANYFQTQNSRWTKWIRKVWLRYADYYVTITKRDLDNFRKHETIRCPIDYAYNPLLMKPANVVYGTGRKVIVSAGHIRPIKNFNIIPRVFAPIVKKHSDWEWRIYGGGNEADMAALRTEIDKYGLSGRVKLMGRTSDMDSVYDESAIYCLTSLQEGLPTVLLEAQAHGVPCVSFDIETGPNEIIEDGISGFVVPAYDVDAMTARLRLLIEDETLRLNMSRGCEYAMRKFEYVKCLDMWKKIITKTMS